MKNYRWHALCILRDVITNQHSLSTAIEKYITNAPPEERPQIKSLCYETTRWYLKLRAQIKTALDKQLKPKDEDLEIAIAIGLCELQYTEHPPYAVISETVNLTQPLKKTWAKGLINAILRKCERKEIQTDFKQNPKIHYAHPQWLIKKIQLAWPQHWQTILENNNEHPPMVIRINQQKITREEYLKQTHISATPGKSPQSLYLTTPCPVTALPQFSEGYCSVQDEAAQLTQQLLDIKPNNKILDACAAPGGKAAHILETQPTVQLTIIDKDETRMKKTHDGLKRLQLPIPTSFTVEAQQTQKWWDKQKFDRILLDAPCSATGVIRRHPDIKLLRQAQDIEALADQQTQLLTALWPLLKPGGILLYVTCSVLPEENSNLIETFISNNTDAKPLPTQLPYAIKQKIGCQILPTKNGPDGFYYAKITKLK